ncbi:trypco2 family protein [Streptomyces populi]|uniref:trypco2 family protein n=1 Tax=Streptomyces populi TaxID=2058924 RepID=UPI0013A70363|nr:trypco2 family protein [Streptomyces populi]
MGDRIPLSDVLDQIRAELVDAAAQSADQDLQFPVGAVQIELQVGVSRSADGKAGLKLYVFELAAGAAVSHQAVQKVIVNLEPPVDREGRRIRVAHELDERP